MEHILRLDRPAKEWVDASPIGNGSLGAMIWGSPGEEKLTLSEETIWAGDPDFKKKIGALRRRFLDGDLTRIDETAEELLEGSFRRVCSAEYAGVVRIATSLTDEPIGYRRTLDLTRGMFKAAYEMGGVEVKETAFCSYADEVIGLRLVFSQPTQIAVRYERENLTRVFAEGNRLTAVGKTAVGGRRFAVGVKLTADGAAADGGDKLTAARVKEASVFIAVTTEFNFGEGFTDTLDAILEDAEDFGALLRDHVADFTALSKRSDLTVESDPALEALPADRRIDRLRKDPQAEDPGLLALYYAFGKYLLLSSSREETLPANLQGVWVDGLESPWNADYHTNINLQMNYWPAETADLGECCSALFRYMNEVLLPSGEKTAKTLYGCRGTVVHHLSDLYGYTGPADGLWGLWPHGAGWLSTHLWEHWLYTGDRGFLRDVAYGFMKACARFYLDYLFEGPDGRLHTGPSASPENRYYLPTADGKQETYLCFSPTMDLEIVSAALRQFAEAARILSLDEKMRREAQEAIQRLPPLTVGPDGRLNEWLAPYEEPEPGHRHVSHAFALYPDCAVGERTQALFDAIRKTLLTRLQHGGGHTGWSRAWLICLFARLRDGKAAADHIRALFADSTLPNLLDTHPPFQIDGNFGGAAGIAETLLQSHAGEIDLLPAVPPGLTGAFTGFKARGNVKVSAAFENGALREFSLVPAKEGAYTVRVPAGLTVRNVNGELPLADGRFTIRLKGGKTARFTCNQI